jgi:hypothetical protein
MLSWPNGAATWSPGLPRHAATLGKRKGWIFQPQRGCDCFVRFSDANDATALRLRIILFSITQRSRSGNVGLEDVAPFGHQQKTAAIQEFPHSQLKLRVNQTKRHSVQASYLFTVNSSK